MSRLADSVACVVLGWSDVAFAAHFTSTRPSLGDRTEQQTLHDDIYSRFPE